MARGSGRTSRAGKKSTGKSRRPTGKTTEKEDSRPMEERLQSIEYHWTSFGPLAKRFLLERPGELTLTKFLNFFSRTEQIAFAQMSVSVGTAHMLAYEYFNVGAYENAKALTLCGAFFQQAQCADTPIEKMAGMSIKDEKNPTELPLYYQGVQATKSDIGTSCYLKRALPLKYQRIMGFESHTQNTPGQQYTDLIANDWKGTSNSNKAKRHNASRDNTEITVVLSNKDDVTEYKKSIKMDTTLKSLFNDYADTCGVSLRSLRFAFNGNTLFLSSVGQKTPLDMGMKNMDTIIVSSNQTSNAKNKDEPVSRPKVQQKKKSQKARKAGRGKEEKKTPVTAQQSISLPQSNTEKAKLMHSKLLSKVFEEMSPKLKVIRQQLNNMMLDRQSSKNKKPSSRKISPLETLTNVSNPSTVGIGGKAGKTSFVVNVGRVENLYKTSKRGRAHHHGSTGDLAKVDLHGCTKEEALGTLGVSLQKWMDTAMHGSYPWVIPAVIVCGGGNQILSETVEAWIRQTKSVANAPKGSVLLR
mmetsp:Transcript_23685/g.50689  ORF Transcript_23685/g.50689 Transcript_23685/m.50689 type:complete len:527 (+) Transcript_23685:127-1707(+)